MGISIGISMGVSMGVSMGILIRCQPATLLCVNFLQQRRGADGYPPLRSVAEALNGGAVVHSYCESNFVAKQIEASMDWGKRRI
jgi:hypothetical protein